MRITVLERASALGAGSSGYSTGFQRAYYSFDETMGFALDGMAAYRDWQSYLGDERAEAKFTETGALWMLGYDGAQNDAMVERLARFNVKVSVDPNPNPSPNPSPSPSPSPSPKPKPKPKPNQRQG
jgi:glycine/D-amino acid oxidase-like deaminating enzyme